MPNKLDKRYKFLSKEAPEKGFLFFKCIGNSFELLEFVQRGKSRVGCVIVEVSRTLFVFLRIY